jgi:hypothetical protein
MAGVLFAPAETFAEIVRKPDVLIPLIVIMVVSAIFAIVAVPRVDFIGPMREQMAQQKPNMAEADLDRAVKIVSASTKILLYASPLLGAILLVIVAFALLMAFRLMGGEGTFKEALSVTVYSWLPFTISGIVATIIIAARGNIPADQLDTLVRSNVAFLADPKSQRLLHTLLGAFDLFTIWSLYLLTIGFSYVARVSRAKAAAIIVSLWAVVLVFKLGFAAIGAAAQAKASAT